MLPLAIYHAWPAVNVANGCICRHPSVASGCSSGHCGNWWLNQCIFRIIEASQAVNVDVKLSLNWRFQGQFTPCDVTLHDVLAGSVDNITQSDIGVYWLEYKILLFHSWCRHPKLRTACTTSCSQRLVSLQNETTRSWRRKVTDDEVVVLLTYG